MIIYVDIDNTICHTKTMDYHEAHAIPERIKTINKLYEQGHEIVYWTARGTKTGMDWEKLTLDQLHDWGCKFSELRMGKPAYDMFIDDKNVNSEDFFYGQ